MINVNLTTTAQRLSLCRIALTSLLLQSRLPDQINLWVSKEPYLRDIGIPNASVIEELIESLPQSFRGKVHVRWVSNIGPYRKLIPVLRESKPNDVIVTADDDIFYGRDWLKGLIFAYEQAKGAPVAVRVRAKRVNFLKIKMSYIHWKLIVQPSVVDDNYIVTFGGGAVLTKAMFRAQDIADDCFLEVAPTADDLWYTKLLMLNNNEVFVIPELLETLHFIKHDDGLINYNFPKMTSFFQRIRRIIWDKPAGLLGVSVCRNDVAYRNIHRHFTFIRSE